MIHETIGQLGHFFVVLSFVTALVATVAYVLSAMGRGQHAEKQAIAEPEPELALAEEGNNPRKITTKRKPRNDGPPENRTPTADRLKTQNRPDDWRTLARYAFYVHGAAILGVIACLYGIVYNHYFEYHYAWSHSSRALPVQYVISCFWEGQEGSFLLWLFWNATVGIILTRTANSRKPRCWPFSRWCRRFWPP